MTTLREAAQQALEALETNNQAWKHLADSGDAGFWEAEEQPFYETSVKAITALRTALAEPEQRPISDVTEAVTKTVIEVEKLLCGKIGRQWQPSGMSIRTLVDELAAFVAAAEREACAKVCEEKQTYSMPIPCPDGIEGCCVAHVVPARREKTGQECAAAIRARSEA